MFFVGSRCTVAFWALLLLQTSFNLLSFQFLAMAEQGNEPTPEEMMAEVLARPLTQEPILVHAGDPQPDDVEKMEEFLHWVNNNPRFKEYWKGDVPAKGYFEDGEQKAWHQLFIQLSLPTRNTMSPAQQIRVWDLIQERCHF